MHEKTSPELPQSNRPIILSVFLIVLGGSFLFLSLAGTFKSLPTLFASASPSPTPVPSPSPEPTPTPTPTPPPPVVKNPVTSCAKFRLENGQATVTINLVSNTGSVTGDTVVRLIPTHACPNDSAQVEHWMKSGETSWTTPPVNPGRYRLEVANGYYQGVVSRNVDLVSGYYTLSINVVNR